MVKQKVLRRAGWRYLKTIGGATQGGFASPTDIAVRSDGMIAVLCRPIPDQIRVQLTAFEDEPKLGEFGAFGTGIGEMARPTGVTFDSEGLLHVADEETNRITAFTVDPDEVNADGGPPSILRRSQVIPQSGKYVSHWGVPGNGDGELNGPSAIAFDPADDLYVVDSRNNRVQKFTKDGRFLLKWGGRGSGEGELNLPWGIAIDDDRNVYVADWRNDRIQKFTADGGFLASFGGSGVGLGQFNRPTHVEVDKDGDIYVADWLNDRVQVLAADGRFVDVFYGDSTLSKWALEDGAGPPGDTIVKMKYLSEDGYAEKYFHRPMAVAMDALGHLFVTDNERFRVQVYLKEAYPSLRLMEVDPDEEPITMEP